MKRPAQQPQPKARLEMPDERLQQKPADSQAQQQVRSRNRDNQWAQKQENPFVEPAEEQKNQFPSLAAQKGKPALRPLFRLRAASASAADCLPPSPLASTRPVAPSRLQQQALQFEAVKQLR